MSRYWSLYIVTRPRVDGAVLLTASRLLKSVSDPFYPNTHNITTAKPLEPESWNPERMLTPHNASCATCHASHVRWHVSHVTRHPSHVRCKFYTQNFSKTGVTKRWRVCYQRGPPSLVSHGAREPQFPQGKTRKTRTVLSAVITIYEDLKSAIHPTGLVRKN